MAFSILAFTQDTLAQGTLSLASLAALSTALVTVAAALLYILGLLTLGWPIYQITKDPATTLYSVSLISKTVVAGQAIRTVGYPLVANVMVLVLLTCHVLLLTLALKIADVLFPEDGAYHTLVLYVMFIMAYSIVVAVFVLLARSLVARWPGLTDLFTKIRDGFFGPPGGYRDMGLRNTFRLVVFMSTLISIIVVVYSELLEYIGFEGITNLISQWHVILIVLVLIFTGAFVISIPEALSHHVPLPHVEVIGPEKTTVGTLLNHSGGVWHLLNRDGILTAIPDGKVEVVRVHAARSE